MQENTGQSLNSVAPFCTLLYPVHGQKADNDAAVMPVGTVWLGVRITTDCIGYRVETEDMIYILLDGVGQFLYSCEMKAVVFGGQNINGQGCTIKP
jgi:hypothetical protein